MIQHYSETWHDFLFICSKLSYHIVDLISSFINEQKIVQILNTGKKFGLSYYSLCNWGQQTLLSFEPCVAKLYIFVILYLLQASKHAQLAIQKIIKLTLMPWSLMVDIFFDTNYSYFNNPSFYYSDWIYPEKYIPLMWFILQKRRLTILGLHLSNPLYFVYYGKKMYSILSTITS